MVNESNYLLERLCPQCGVPTAELRCPADGTPTVVASRESRHPLSYRAGEIINGRYELSEILGRGGFGAVFAARHVGTAQPVAIKMLAADLDAANDEPLRRFHREARVTAGLTSPHTVRVFDVGQAEAGPLFLVMELIRGVELGVALRAFKASGSRMDELAAVEIGIQILKSLAEAHAAGLVHRDLKPANVMLTLAGQDEVIVKVLDFGIAQAANASKLTAAGMALGTPAFMSPEQVCGKPVDGRSDLYSLGVLLFHCVCGRLPFDAQSGVALAQQHLHAPVPDIRKLAPGTSPATVACIERALAKEPAGRFEDARAMRDALEAARHRLQGSPSAALSRVSQFALAEVSRGSAPAHLEAAATEMRTSSSLRTRGAPATTRASIAATGIAATSASAGELVTRVGYVPTADEEPEETRAAPALTAEPIRPAVDLLPPAATGAIAAQSTRARVALRDPPPTAAAPARSPSQAPARPTAAGTAAIPVQSRHAGDTSRVVAQADAAASRTGAMQRVVPNFEVEVLARAAEPAHVGAAAPVPPSDPQRGGRGVAIWLALAALAVVMAAGVGAALLLREPASEAAAPVAPEAETEAARLRRAHKAQESERLEREQEVEQERLRALQLEAKLEKQASELAAAKAKLAGNPATAGAPGTPEAGDAPQAAAPAAAAPEAAVGAAAKPAPAPEGSNSPAQRPKRPAKTQEKVEAKPKQADKVPRHDSTYLDL